MKKAARFKAALFLLVLNLFFYVSHSQSTLIKTGDEWYYYDEANAPVSGWEKHSTGTDNWKTGVSPLGYGDDIIATNIRYGQDSVNKDITKYFKKTFRVENPFAHLVYKLNVQRDDGIVVYLNGYEIMRDNMPEGIITDSTKAVNLIWSSEIEAQIHTKLLTPDDFIVGVNTIGVSVHQARSTSSDCLFNLELIGDDNTDMIPLLLREQTIKNLNLESKLKELNHEHELEKKEIQLDFEKQTKSNIKIGLYATSISFLGSLFTLFYLILLSKKKKIALLKNIEHLKETNLIKDRELISSSSIAVQGQQFLKELKDNLSTILNGDINTKKEIQNIIRKIDYNIEHDDDWMNLLNHFNSVHPGFWDKLKKLHPSLSETEQRHCIFIKLHMQTKEIANILHIDPRSVQASRYRIKKKMELDENTDLKEYLLSV